MAKKSTPKKKADKPKPVKKKKKDSKPLKDYHKDIDEYKKTEEETEWPWSSTEDDGDLDYGERV